jgi:hypothetical protein
MARSAGSLCAGRIIPSGGIRLVSVLEVPVAIGVGTFESRLIVRRIRGDLGVSRIVVGRPDPVRRRSCQGGSEQHFRSVCRIDMSGC